MPKESQIVVLITCVAPKVRFATKAKELYTGELFQQLWSYGQLLHPDQVFILSGKHHLLHPDTIIEPYDVNLNEASEDDLRHWSKKVVTQLSRCADLRQDTFYILANETYRKYLTDKIQNYRVPIHIL